ncbi:MAG: type II secretion system protein GspE [Flavobacterium sp.]|nr:type II secretion system protein GspE [Flavobacterium sp.]
MGLTSEQLKKIVVDQGFIKEKDFSEAEKEAKEKEKDLEDILIEKDLIEDKQLGELIAQELEFPFVNLGEEVIDEEILRIIPEIVARNQMAIAFFRDKEGLKIAMANPKDLDFIVNLQKKTGEKIFPYYATKKDINEALVKYKKPLKEEFEEIITKGLEEIEATTKKELPIIRIVDSIVEYGYQNKASDIHIEPQEVKTVIRYRIDGILHDVVDLPKEVHEYLISRIKILAELRIDEHRSAQDGRFSKKFDSEKVDVRVSIVPTTKGEKVVLRLLSERVRRFDLDDIGFSEENFAKVKKNIKKPWGMILATGPTGSGKTTTLYAILKILNQREVNIATIEDPVEYDIGGINQIHVDPSTNLTFTEGLKSILRQDPDVIMVGEIRDKETAKIAINAALTGHLVLSTLHTNDAAGSLPRLINMEIEPFLVASTVNLIVAQRLIRRICPKCITSRILEKKEILESLRGSPEILKKLLSLLEKKPKLRIYFGKGCPLCYNSGYLGRIALFEVLEMTEPIREVIMKKADAATIKNEAIKDGMITMIDDGLNKVFTGLTTLDEILKATKE